MIPKYSDVLVVGGGMGGLAVAALVSRSGLGVHVLERATTLGGRAATHERQGFLFNEGAHALYRGGAAARVLGTLGVAVAGRRPPARGLMVRGGRAYAMPSTLGAMLTTGLVGAAGKLEGARVFARLGGLDLEALAGERWSDWLASQVTDAPMRAALDAFARVATYANAPRDVSAGATLAQLRLAQNPGVAYLDRGWQPLVDGVAAVARARGVAITTGARVAHAEPTPNGWRVATTAGDVVHTRVLVLATGPATAAAVVEGEPLASWAARAVPARTACLDVALSRLPNARATFALGVDAPTYLSVHSRTARLAPDGAPLVSTMKYLPPGEAPDAARDRAELESLLDLLQPGWRDVVVERRFLPSMVASNAIVLADGGGFAGRPTPRVPSVEGLYVVGDWVGGEGMLLDASLASAERAASDIAATAGVARVA